MEGLKRNDPKTLNSFLRPKIHKEDNPGHPLVSSVTLQIFQNMSITTFLIYS